MKWRGKFPTPRKNKYIDPTFIEGLLAGLLWWFAYDVNNREESHFIACQEDGHMQYVYAALQRYQWLQCGPWAGDVEARGPAPGSPAARAWAEESIENDNRTLWLKQVAEFLPWLWD